MTEVVEAQGQRLNQQEKDLKAAEKQILPLQEIIQLHKAQKFAASSEKSTFQLDLFDEAELEVALDDAIAKLPEEPDESPELKALRKECKTRNRAFPADLPRKRIELSLSEEEKQGAVKTFFTKVKEEHKAQYKLAMLHPIPETINSQAIGESLLAWSCGRTVPSAGQEPPNAHHLAMERLLQSLGV